MPLRADPSLWFNLPGIVAAYQPVRAPDPLLARYNMRMSGTSAFRAEPGVVPAWSAATGWTFDGTTQFFTTGIVPASTWSMVISFTGGVLSSKNWCMIGYYDGTQTRTFCIWQMTGPNNQFGNGILTEGTGSVVTQGTLAIAAKSAYKNGVYNVTIGAGDLSDPRPLFIGKGNAIGWHCGTTTRAASIYNRTLSPAEVWTVSRQMQYCDVNPDWSAWSPRRKWYPYVLQAAGRAGIYGARPTVALPGGVRIVPQDEGGVNG